MRFDDDKPLRFRKGDKKPGEDSKKTTRKPIDSKKETNMIRSLVEKSLSDGKDLNGIFDDLNKTLNKRDASKRSDKPFDKSDKRPGKSDRPSGDKKPHHRGERGDRSFADKKKFTGNGENPVVADLRRKLEILANAEKIDNKSNEDSGDQ